MTIRNQFWFELVDVESQFHPNKMADRERNNKKPKIETADIEATVLDQDVASDNELESHIQITKNNLQYMMITLSCWGCDDLFPIPWRKRIADLSFRCTLSFSRLQTKVEPCDWEQIRSELDSNTADFHTVKNFWMEDVLQNSYKVFLSTLWTQPPGPEETETAGDIEESELSEIETTQTSVIEDTQLPESQ